MINILILLFALFGSPAFAQNTTCANKPANDSSNACANTRYVTNAISSIIPISFPSVANNTQLSTFASTSTNAIIRLGYATAGDAPEVVYLASNSACSLNAGAGDGGSQVPTSDGKCWLAILPAQPDIRIWGANTISVDNTAKIQAAMNVAQTIFVPSGTFITSNLVLTRNNKFIGSGLDAILSYKTGSTGYMIESTSSFRLQIETLTLYGGSALSYAGVTSPGTRSAVHLWSNIDSTSITKSYIYGFNNIALGMNGDTSPVHAGTLVHGNTISNNYCAIDTGPSGVNNDTCLGGANPAEYLKISNNTMNNNRYAMIGDSGNLDIIGNSISTNGYCLFLSGTVTNGGHGTFSGNLCNHSTLYAIYTTASVINGYSIVGNQFYFGAWVIVNGGGGFSISGNTINTTSITLSGPGTFNFTNNWFATSPTITDTSFLTVWDGNFNFTTQSFIQDKTGLIVDPRAIYATATQGISGPNLVTDGGFTSGASWTTGTGWSIAANKASNSGSFGLLSQSIGATSNAVYSVTYTLSDYVSGYISLGIGGTVTGAPHAANGTYTDIIGTGAGTDGKLYFISSPCVCSITNVTVYAYPHIGTLNVANVNMQVMSLAIPSVQTGSTYIVLPGDTVITANSAGTLTLTMPAAVTYPGRILKVRTIAAQTVVSASSNIVPLAGGAAGTAILSATAGKWAELQSDGTNWNILEGN